MFEFLVPGRDVPTAAARALRWAGGVCLVLALATAAQAQMIPIPEDHATESPFDLTARGDYGVVGFRASGAAGWCSTNVSGTPSPRRNGCAEAVVLNTPTGNWFTTFEMPFIIAAPRSDLPEGIDPAELSGAGYNYQSNATLPTRLEEFLASDRSGRDLLNLGVVSTSDGSCRDFSGLATGRVTPGFQLLPHTSCQPTWPNPDEWQGRRRITLEGFIAAQSAVAPAGDPFAFWRVPEEFQTTRPLGDQASYGEFTDWSVDALARYPAVIPGGGGGTPTIRGWPMGLTVQFDVFNFNLPTVNNAYFIQYLIINESEQVYNTPVDYDSLYVGLMRLPGNGGDQFQTFHYDIPRGGWYTARCRNRPPAIAHPWGGSPAGCSSLSSFRSGAWGLMFLKSPIGDLRNKLLSDPSSAFFDPSHPNAGDTITFNHSRICTFITCSSQTIDFSERAAFGMMSSTLNNVLDGRPVSDLDDGAFWNSINSSESFPERGDFNKYVPGVHDDKPVWDYNKDGEPDTLYVDTCGSKGCVPLWHDTLPGGVFNRAGQTAPMSIGPFPLRAGDTTALVVAYIADRDSVAFEATIQNVFDFYMTFFFGPEAAPPPAVKTTAVAVTGGAQDSTSVRINWNDATRNYVDPFLLKLADDMEAAGPTTALGKIRDLNAGILQQLRDRALDNVEQIYVFRSCDGGNTFTSGGNCLPNSVPSGDGTSKWAGIGWLPWATLAPDVNSVTDNNARGGLSYLYSIVTETKGARFQILLDQGQGEVPRDASGTPICIPSRCEPAEFEFSPPILSPLNKTADAPGVVAVYVPISRKAGTLLANSEVQSDVGEALVPVTVSLAQGARDGTFRAVFADTLNITTVVTGTALSGGRIDTTSVQLTVTTSGAQPQTLTGSRPLTMRGETEVSATTETQGETVVITRQHRIVSGSTRAVPMVLLETTGGQSQPMLASGVLAAGRTTPGGFVDRADFPGFFIDVAADRGTTFGSQTYVTPVGDTLQNDIVAGATVAWQTGSSAALAGVFGKYSITWADQPYGPGEPFGIGSGLQDRVSGSINSRSAASQSVDDPELADRINAALSAADRATVADLQLSTLSLPFRIRNETDGRDVEVAVIQHNASVLLGEGTDTQRVSVPSAHWAPGDRLVLLERMSVEDGGQTVDQLVPTWDVLVGCTGTLRTTCDATVGSSYAPVFENGTRIDVIYFRPLVAGSEFMLNVSGARTDVAQTRNDLNQIRVVPNPYVVLSLYERNPADRIIKFTNVPDEGRLRIYTVSGQFVQELSWTAEILIGTAGDLIWDLKSRENTEIAYGLYIWVLDSPAGSARGKFVVIR